MKLFKKVGIVGIGLVGGSLALAVKKKGLAKEVVGVSRHRKTLNIAKRNHIIDKGSQDIGIVKDADLVILATPVSTIIDLAPKISRIINPETFVTDVGSTKKEIVSRLDKIFPRYVGSHPLAGSEKRGVIHASSNIFGGSLCILTPTRKTDNNALTRIKAFWKALGARTVSLSPERHDKILSFVSHAPHLAAFSLIDIIPPGYLKFASSGLKDTTRIAASDAQLWADIFLSNEKYMLKATGLFQQRLNRIKNAILKKNRRALIKILAGAKKKRDALL